MTLVKLKTIVYAGTSWREFLLLQKRRCRFLLLQEGEALGVLYLIIGPESPDKGHSRLYLYYYINLLLICSQRSELYFICLMLKYMFKCICYCVLRPGSDGSAVRVRHGIPASTCANDDRYNLKSVYTLLT